MLTLTVCYLLALLFATYLAERYLADAAPFHAAPAYFPGRQSGYDSPMPTAEAILAHSAAAYAAESDAWFYSHCALRTAEIAAETAYAAQWAAGLAFRRPCSPHPDYVVAPETALPAPHTLPEPEVCALAANSPVVRSYAVVCDRQEPYVSDTGMHAGWIAYSGHDEARATRLWSYYLSRRDRFGDVASCVLIVS